MSDDTNMTQVSESSGEVMQVTQNGLQTAPLHARAHDVTYKHFCVTPSLEKENQVVRSDDGEKSSSRIVTSSREATQNRNDVQSVAHQETDEEFYARKAAARAAYLASDLGQRTLRAIGGHQRRMNDPKHAQWARDEREKAAMADRAARKAAKQVTRRTTLPLERDEQATLVRWLKAHGVRYNANLEGVNRHFAARSAALHAGMRRGRPDIEVLSVPPLRPDIRGVAIELKRRKGPGSSPRVSQEQVDRLAEYREEGWLAEVHYGADSAIRWLGQLGFGR